MGRRNAGKAGRIPPLIGRIFRPATILIISLILVLNVSLGLVIDNGYTQAEKAINPLSLIPEGSSAVMHLEVSNVSLFLYEKNGSYAGIIPFGLSTIFIDRSHSIHDLNASGVQITRYSTFGSTGIFRIGGIDLESASRGMVNIIGAFSNGARVANTTYISDSIGGNTVAGSLAGVKDSIRASSSSANATLSGELNLTTEASMVYYQNSSVVQRVTVNSTSNSTMMKIFFTNSTSEQNFLAAYHFMVLNFLIFPLPLKFVNSHEYSMDLNMNIYQFISFISHYWLTLNRYAGGHLI